MRHLGLHLELTDRCNLACAHCYRVATPADLPVATAVAIARDAWRLGARTLSLGGAEPTLHHGLAEVIVSAQELGYQVSLTTNGHRLRELLRELRPHMSPGGVGLTRVGVSLDGATSDAHDAIRSPGSHQEAVAALLLAKSQGLQTQVKTVVSRRNAEEVDAIVRTAARLMADRIQLAAPIPTRGLVERGLLLSPTELALVRERALSAARAYAVPVELHFSLGGHTPYAVCGSAQCRVLAVNAAGRGVLCCLLSECAQASEAAPWVLSEVASAGAPHVFGELVVAAHRLLRWRAALTTRAGALSPAALYPCALCAALHGQLEWLVSFPDSVWATLLEDLARLRPGSGAHDPGLAMSDPGQR